MADGDEAPKLPERLPGETPEDYHRRVQQQRMEYTPAAPTRAEIVAEQTHDKTQKILDECRASGEPIFVIRAKDILAPMLVAEYYELIEKYCPRQHHFHGQVAEIQDQMLDWQRANGDKVGYPD